MPEGELGQRAWAPLTASGADVHYLLCARASCLLELLTLEAPGTFSSLPLGTQEYVSRCALQLYKPKLSQPLSFLLVIAPPPASERGNEGGS